MRDIWMWDDLGTLLGNDWVPFRQYDPGHTTALTRISGQIPPILASITHGPQPSTLKIKLKNEKSIIRLAPKIGVKLGQFGSPMRFCGKKS